MANNNDDESQRVDMRREREAPASPGVRPGAQGEWSRASCPCCGHSVALSYGARSDNALHSCPNRPFLSPRVHVPARAVPSPLGAPGTAPGHLWQRLPTVSWAVAPASVRSRDAEALYGLSALGFSAVSSVKERHSLL